MPHKVDYEFLNQSRVTLPTVNYSSSVDKSASEGSIVSIPDSITIGGEPIDHQRFLENFGGFLGSRKIFQDPDTGNNVSTYWANRDQLADNSHNLAAVVTTWTSSMESNGGNRREYALAAAMNPETPFVIIDNPGSGFSTKLPDDVIKHTSKTGEFDEAAAIVTRALADAEHYPRAFMGVSTGARYAIAAARSNTADNLSRIGAIDPPGRSGYGRLRMLVAMATELGVHAPKSGNASTDPYLHPDIYFGTPPEWQEMVGPKELGEQLRDNNSTKQKFLQLPKAMSRQEGLETDISVGLNELPEATLDLVLPMKSELSPVIQLNELGNYLAELAIKVDDGGFISRARTIGIPDATHYFTSAYPKKVGSIITQILK